MPSGAPMVTADIYSHICSNLRPIGFPEFMHHHFYRVIFQPLIQRYSRDIDSQCLLSLWLTFRAVRFQHSFRARCRVSCLHGHRHIFPHLFEPSTHRSSGACEPSFLPSYFLQTVDPTYSRHSAPV